MSDFRLPTSEFRGSAFIDPTASRGVVRPAKAQEIEDMRLEFGQRLMALSQNSALLRKNQRCGQDVGGRLVHGSELSFCLRGL
jgi:hypothetical protein